MLFFTKKTRPLVGLDVGASSIKLVELSKIGDKYQLDYCGLVDIPGDVIVNKHVNNINILSLAINDVVSASKTKTKASSIAVSGPSVFSKRIKVLSEETINENFLKDAVQSELNKLFPNQTDKMFFDFGIPEPNKDDPSYSDLLVHVANKDVIQGKIDAFEASKLSVKIVDIEAYALRCAYINLIKPQLTQDAHNKFVALVNVGACDSSLTIYHNDDIVFYREQSFGGNSLTDDICDRFGLTRSEAVIAKYKGGLPSEYEAELLSPFKKKMTAQIARLLQNYLNTNSNNGVDFVVLCGGCASIDKIDTYIANEISMPVLIANPFIDMKISPNVDLKSIINHANSYLLACGLALRKFD